MNKLFTFFVILVSSQIMPLAAMATNEKPTMWESYKEGLYIDIAFLITIGLIYIIGYAQLVPARIYRKGAAWAMVLHFFPIIFVGATYFFPEYFEATILQSYEMGWILNTMVAVILAFAYGIAVTLKNEPLI